MYFELGADEYICDEALHKQTEEATKGLDEVLVENRARRFEIRPVFAVKRCVHGELVGEER